MVAGITATIVRRGDGDAGVVFIKQNFLDGGFVILSPQRDDQGELGWLRATGAEPVDEATADGYIARQVSHDSDLWVIEIEQRSGPLPFPHKFL